MLAIVPFFTSKRERRLWLWALLVVVTIYSTLGLAGTLSDVLRDRGMFDSFFILGFFLLLAVVAIQGLTTRPGIAEVGVFVGIVAVYFMVFARMGIPEERTHLFEYSLVAILIYQALVERRKNGRNISVPWLIAIAATALLGWIDEGIQPSLPNRVYDIRDVGFNALAGLMAILGTVALMWARRRVPSRKGVSPRSQL